MSVEYDEVDSFWLTNEYCVASELEKGSCKSSDALSLYENNPESGEVYFSGYCRSCNTPFNHEELSKSSHASLLGIAVGGVENDTPRKVFTKKAKTPPLTREEVRTLMTTIGFPTKDYRGLKPEYMRYFGHLVKYNPEGTEREIYYPETQYLDTQDAYPCGYKIRIVKGKHFTKLGKTGLKGIDPSGFIKAKDVVNHRDVIIVGGENDKVAVHQVFAENAKTRKTEWAIPTVISPTCGEGNFKNQAKLSYDWLEGFDNIYLALDNDTAGREAMAELVKVLPKDKVKVIYWTGKDPHAMLESGKTLQVMQDFYNAKEVVESGILSSSQLYDAMVESLKVKTLTLPPAMKIAQDMTRRGGLTRGSAPHNIIGKTSEGKSSIVNFLSTYWMTEETEDVVGIISLEATAGEYTADIVGNYIENNLSWIPQEEIDDYFSNKENSKIIESFLHKEDGSPRFYVLDDRGDFSITALEKKLEQMIKKFGCTVIIIDPLSDILRTSEMAVQEQHLNFQSALIKSTGVTIVNVLHTRKDSIFGKGLPKKVGEYDALGSSMFPSKAFANLIINRNKHIAKLDPIEGNTTYLDWDKLRKGETGSAGALFYDGATRKLYDRDLYFKENPDKLPTGYDLSVSSYDRAYWEEGGWGYDFPMNPIPKKENKGFNKPRNNTPQEKDFMDNVPL